jgi:hypothetical protein
LHQILKANLTKTISIQNNQHISNNKNKKSQPLSAEIEITNLTSELIRGSLHVAGTNTLPLSTFFLLLDRIFAVSFLGARLDRWRRHSQWISTTCIALLFTICICVLVYRTLIFPPSTSLCKFVAFSGLKFGSFEVKSVLLVSVY